MSPFAGLAGGAGWLGSRDDTSWAPQGSFDRSTNTIFQTDNNNRTVSTTQQMFFNELKFSAAKSIRTSTIILASFNIIAAFATALGILCDSYFRKKMNDKKFRFWYGLRQDAGAGLVADEEQAQWLQFRSRGRDIPPCPIYRHLHSRLHLCWCSVDRPRRPLWFRMHMAGTTHAAR